MRSFLEHRVEINMMFNEHRIAMAVASNELSLLVFVVLCLLIPTSCLSSQGNFDQQVALFVFGDSLFDPGNNNYINTTTDFQANHWPYGQSYFSTPTGRFTDGRIIPDFIGEQHFKVI